MKKVKFLKDDRGCPDGITVVAYAAGQEYEVNDSLFRAFVEDRKTAVEVAEEVGTEEEAAKPEKEKRTKGKDA